MGRGGKSLRTPALEHKDWTQEQWNSVVFSDESKFDVSVGDQRGRVVRNKHEGFHESCLKRTVKFPAGQMIWGCMSNKGVAPLCFIDGTVNANKYQNILQEHLLPSMQQFNCSENMIFQQDGASCHTAKSSIKWLNDHKIKVMEWPSSSPDLNPIENLWGQIKKKLRCVRPRTKQILKENLSELWSQINAEDCQNLYNSMHKRMQGVIAAKGDVTRY